MATSTSTTTTTTQSPQEQLESVWESLLERNKTSSNGEQCKQQRTWPSYDKILTNIKNADYNDTLHCPYDLKEQHEKALCPYGVVCRAKLELFDGESLRTNPYTGLLTPNTTHEHCLLRLSSGIKPPATELKALWARAILRVSGDKLRNAKLFPTAALKIFRAQAASGNILFAGSKVGQRDQDYFAHSQCTQVTEQMPRGIKPFIRKFWNYSDYPFSLGLSDLCWHSVEGKEVEPEDLNFPYCLVLHPIHRLTQHELEVDSFDRFLDDVLSIPANTHLFDVFACPDPRSVPDPSKLQRIGRIMSTCDMMPSSHQDGLFFKHQRKEEDFVLKPDWKEQVTSIECHVGKTVGTVNKLAGWKLFEAHIAQGAYEDFETTTTAATTV